MAQNKSYAELMKLAGAQTGTNAQKANAMLELIEGRKPFSYNAATDPAARTVRKETARNIARTTADTLGSHAAMTGGVPSSAAVSAAAQAGSYAGAQGVDKIAELEQLAYQNYQTEGDRMNTMWSMFQSQADAEADRKLQMAQLAASYGDYSGLKEMGIDTSKMESGYGSGYTAKKIDDSEDDNEGGGLGDAAYNALVMRYPGGTIPASEWASLAAQYGEGTLTAAGFRKAAATARDKPQRGYVGQPDKPEITLN